MIVSYSNGTDFLQANQALLQENPYLSTFFTLDAPLLKQADTINYALRCEQGDNWLLALKVEPYNLLLLGDEACVPELLQFLFDGGCELKNYLCASELGYVMQRELEPYGRRYEEALAMDFMEARTVTEPSAPEVETAGKGDLDEIFACAQRFVADCGLLDKPEKEPFRKVLDSFRILRADGKIVSMARIAPATQDDLRLVRLHAGRIPRKRLRPQGGQQREKRDPCRRQARDAERRPEKPGLLPPVPVPRLRAHVLAGRIPAGR